MHVCMSLFKRVRQGSKVVLTRLIKKINIGQKTTNRIKNVLYTAAENEN